MNNVVNVKELRLNMEHYINAVSKGKSFLVMKRSKPVFQIMPIKEISLADDGPGWKTLIDFRKLKKEGISADEVVKVLDKMIKEDRERAS